MSADTKSDPDRPPIHVRRPPLRPDSPRPSIACIILDVSLSVPIAFAHRGAMGYLPENTMPAFALALRQGATGLESDAWLAADGVPVLVHDRTVRRPGRRIDVTRRTSSELAAFDVPRLADLYASLGTGFELSLDLEHPEVAEPAVDVAASAGAEARLWACHEEPEVLRRLRHHSSRVRLVCTTGRHRIERSGLVEGGFGRLLPELAAMGTDALNLRWREWDAPLVELVHAAGLLAFGWDAQEPRAVARLVGLGIDGIYADHPDRLVAAIAEAGRP
jgi:glycerophosphoryl diester phosphodiesterase